MSLCRVAFRQRQLFGKCRMPAATTILSVTVDGDVIIYSRGSPPPSSPSQGARRKERTRSCARCCSSASDEKTGQTDRGTEKTRVQAINSPPSVKSAALTSSSSSSFSSCSYLRVPKCCYAVRRPVRYVFAALTYNDFCPPPSPRLSALIPWTLCFRNKRRGTATAIAEFASPLPVRKLGLDENVERRKTLGRAERQPGPS